MTDNPLPSATSQIEDQNQLPQDQSRYYAPFSIWRVVRILELCGFCFSIVGMAVLLLSVVYGWQLGSLSGGWIGFSIIVFSGLLAPRGTNVGSPGPSIPAQVARRRLTSDRCPTCNQSIFDRHPATGYVDVFAATSFWPLQQCSNCGHDMTVAQNHDR